MDQYSQIILLDENVIESVVLEYLPTVGNQCLLFMDIHESDLNDACYKSLLYNPSLQ